VKLIIQIGICSIVLLFCGASLYGQEAPSNDTLFQKLQTGRTSRQAFEQFVKLGKRNSDVRKYLADRLPEKIAAGPGDKIGDVWHPTKNLLVWENDVLLAGYLQIVEAIPALVQHIDQLVEQGVGGLSSEELLENYPAGAALGHIGEPAIAALSSVLETGSIQKRWVTSRALNMIEGAAATEALSNHLAHESDAKLRAHMEAAVQYRRAGIPH
jgi:hypothetical protein